MRVRIVKSSSTKAERRFSEILKRNHLAFRYRVIIEGREVDFLLGKLAIEIGDHSQDVLKNKKILEAGYSMLFIKNSQLRDAPLEVERDLLVNWIKK